MRDVSELADLRAHRFRVKQVDLDAFDAGRQRQGAARQPEDFRVGQRGPVRRGGPAADAVDTGNENNIFRRHPTFYQGARAAASGWTFSFYLSPPSFYLHPMPVIFGLDPSLRSTGYGILAVEGRSLRALAYGVIKNADKVVPSRCLVAIHQRVTDLIQEHQPDCAAVEGIIYLQNYQTAITLGSARGAALLALAEAGLPIYEYAPRRVESGCDGTRRRAEGAGRLHGPRDVGADGESAPRCGRRAGPRDDACAEYGNPRRA